MASQPRWPAAPYSPAAKKRFDAKTTEIANLRKQLSESQDENQTKTLTEQLAKAETELNAAKEAARFFDADMLRIEAPEYPRTVAGNTLAARHADEHLTRTEIHHEPVDPAAYELVVLCSPTWWYRPAIPLWTFVEDHDLGGTHVFLLMTGNRS